MSKNEVTVFEEAFLSKLAELEAGTAPSPAIDKLASAYGFDQGANQGTEEVSYESLLGKLAEDALAVRPKGIKGTMSRAADSVRYHGAKALNAAKEQGGKAWGAVKNNPGRTAAGVAGAAGLGYAGYKAYKAMKGKKDDE